MSLLNNFFEDTEWDLRQMERDMQRQMRLLDRHLQHLRNELLPCCPCCSCSPLPTPPCLCPGSRMDPCRAVTAARDAERELASMQRKLNRMRNARERKVLAVMDVEGFDPEDVVVTVKDRKVHVLAEHEEAHTTTRGNEYNYKNVKKEISLPLGVSEDEVMYSLGPNNLVKIETTNRRCPCLPRV